MAQILYGYKMESGNVVIDSKAAEKIRILFNAYLKCGSLRKAAKIAGIDKTHSSIGNMLKNRRYLGDAYYPRIIDDELFQKVENIRLDKARTRKCIDDEKLMPKTKFYIDKIGKIKKDPYEQAEYIYSLIMPKDESEEINE